MARGLAQFRGSGPVLLRKSGRLRGKQPGIVVSAWGPRVIPGYIPFTLAGGCRFRTRGRAFTLARLDELATMFADAAAIRAA